MNNDRAHSSLWVDQDHFEYLIAEESVEEVHDSSLTKRDKDQ